LADVVIPLVDSIRWRRRTAALVLACVVLGACGGDGSSGGDLAEDRGPNKAPPQTLAGGIELPKVDPVSLLVGDGLAYGTPLPSEQAAADAYLEDPEVRSVVARRLYSRRDGRLLGDVVVLALDGQEIFDESVLDVFVETAVGALGDGAAEAVPMAGRDVLRSRGAAGTVMGYREGDQLLLVRGPNDHDIGVVLERQLKARAAKAPGAAQPFTPLLPTPIDAAFTSVPTITFQPIPPEEEEPPPETPPFPGATGTQGRYGVVAGERRTTIWAYSLDVPRTYASAEALEPAMAGLVSGRAGGAPAEAVEVFGKVVVGADGADGTPSARAFRHGGIVLLVEGQVPGQLDAVITAWLEALSA
jgi:hypothetical protein